MKSCGVPKKKGGKWIQLLVISLVVVIQHLYIDCCCFFPKSVSSSKTEVPVVFVGVFCRESFWAAIVCCSLKMIGMQGVIISRKIGTRWTSD